MPSYPAAEEPSQRSARNAAIRRLLTIGAETFALVLSQNSIVM
jgi:hypothetical protein